MRAMPLTMSHGGAVDTDCAYSDTCGDDYLDDNYVNSDDDGRDYHVLDDNDVPIENFVTTTVKKLKWFGQELTKLWKEKSNEKERIFIYLAIDPTGQCDLQGHMIFYMTYKLYGLSRSLTNLWLNPTYNKRDFCNWKFNDVMFARPEVT